MAGSVLGQDQIARVNAAYAPLLAHIRGLIAADRSPIGLMKVHYLTDGLDSTEMYRIFAELPFLSPTEKRALVRAAVYEVLIKDGLVASPVTVEPRAAAPTSAAPAATQLSVFTPARLTLNPATTDTLQEKAAPAPERNVPETGEHRSVVAQMTDRGDAQKKATQADIDQAMADLKSKNEAAVVPNTTDAPVDVTWTDAEEPK